MANVFKLAHIARKGEQAQLLKCRVGNAFRLSTQLLGALLQEVPCQCNHIFAALAQGRQAQADHIQSVKQVFAEKSVLDALLQVLVCRGDHARIRFDRVVAAHPVKVTIAENAQQTRLQVKRHVTDFIKKKRAALGLLKAAPAHGLGTGKGAAFVTKQLALEQIFRNRCGIDGNKRTVGARGVLVQSFGDQLFAGA